MLSVCIQKQSECIKFKLFLIFNSCNSTQYFEVVQTILDSSATGTWYDAPHKNIPPHLRRHTCMRMHLYAHVPVRTPTTTRLPAPVYARGSYFLYPWVKAVVQRIFSWTATVSQWPYPKTIFRAIEALLAPEDFRWAILKFSKKSGVSQGPGEPRRFAIFLAGTPEEGKGTSPGPQLIPEIMHGSFSTSITRLRMIKFQQRKHHFYSENSAFQR